MSFAAENEPFAKPETLLRVPVGLASPLWGLFAGAAVTGATWWWMTRWARPENLEALFGAASEALAPIEPEVVALTAPVIEAVEAAVETVPELVAEPVLEAVVEAPLALEPVGGEAAPISLFLEALTPEPVEPALPGVEPAEPPVVAGGAADVALEAAPAPKIKKKLMEPKAE